MSKPVVQDANVEESYGTRFFREYLNLAKRVEWNYQTIQQIKNCDREAFIQLLQSRGTLPCDALQQLRTSTAEESAQRLAAAYAQKRSDVRLAFDATASGVDELMLVLHLLGG